MLPKDSPERTIENDWRLKKKFEKLVKDLPALEPQGKRIYQEWNRFILFYVTAQSVFLSFFLLFCPVEEMSPIIIDEENGIIYSPALKRSDYMAQRLKDMKDKRENISPTGKENLKTYIQLKC